MKTMTGGALALAALLAVNPMGLDAQRHAGGRGMGPGGGQDGPGIEALMRMSDELELTDEQVAQLEQMRQEGVAHRTAHMSQVEALRSELAAGRIERSDMMAALEEHRDAAASLRGAQRQRVEAILTEAQRGRLETMGRTARAFRAGAAVGAQRGAARMHERSMGARHGGGPRGPASMGRGGARGHHGFRGARGPARGPAFRDGPRARRDSMMPGRRGRS